MRLITVYKYKKQNKVEMKITQIRETESAEAISVFNFESFVEKIKVETKARRYPDFVRLCIMSCPVNLVIFRANYL